MENYQIQNEKDPALWSIAKKRAEFKRAMVYYVVINAFLWVLWLLANYNGFDGDVPWPVWPTAGWGLAMIIEYVSIYRYPKENAAEKEYEKLKQLQNK